MALLRIGVVGIGFGQQVHVPAFRQDSRCTVTAIGAHTQARAEDVARLMNIPVAYGDWTALVRSSEVDVVSIATPPVVQMEIARAALASGKHVFCEKPIAISVEAASQLVQAAQMSGQAHMVDFEFPDIDEWIQAKEILSSGTLGTLRHLSITWNVETYANRTKSSSWKTRTAEGGGALHSCVSHCFYYLEWMLGPIRKITCSLHHMPGRESDSDSLAVLILEMESGLPVQITMCTHAFRGNGHRLEFFGEEGSLRLDNPTSDYVNGFEIWLATRSAPVFTRIPSLAARNESDDGRVVVVGKLVKRFVSAIFNGTEVRPNLRDGLRVQILLQSAMISAQTGQRVSVESFI